MLLEVAKFVLPFLAGGLAVVWRKTHHKVVEYFDSKIHNQRARTIFLRLDHMVDATTNELIGTARDGIELFGQGSLTHEARHALLRQAVERVCVYMSEHGMSELSEVLRMTEEVAVKFVESKIEAKLQKLRLEHGSNGPVAINTGIRLPPPTL